MNWLGRVTFSALATHNLIYNNLTRRMVLKEGLEVRVVAGVGVFGFRRCFSFVEYKTDLD